MKRIVLLYNNAGGGHKSAALSIAQGIREIAGDSFEISLANAFDRLPFPFDTAEKDYPRLVNYGRPLYSSIFKATNGRRRVVALRKAFEPITDEMAASIVKEHPADLYISCHPVYNQYMPAKIRELGSPAKYVNVVTDLVTGHLFHYASDVDLCIVPTDASREKAIEAGLAPEKVVVCGQPVWPGFEQRMGNRDETRKALGLSNDLPVVLLIGGGEGMGRIEITARELAFSSLPIQLVVVCGKNKSLKRNIDFINPRVPIMRALGFVNFMPELMGASDILVTKAGPGTISEGFIAGLPILMFDAVPGQEEGNVSYVVNNGAGAWCPNPFLVTRQLKQWLADEEGLAKMKAASLSLARPNSAIDIAKTAISFLER